ncbi:unnamed protein product, partial [Heligmosomoides polygyrus]|uniref:Integrase_H2C2 domain-containing protein n=1 Tax=Heligmosomoides polygyrus TaxID=6339 RepID=A0A183GWS4_HELPZ
MDEKTQLWRSRGRTANSSLPFDTNNPKILFRRQWITWLYIFHCHEENHHIGVAQTLTTLRQLVWISQVRTEVRKVIKKLCMYCRKEKAAPYRLPLFPDYAKERPFTCLNTRALYVDIATSLSASCFPNVLHRFIASNGCPRGTLSDNAPVFVSVVTMLSPLLTEDDQNLFDYSSRLNIPFKFVPAFAPWQSGIYER